MYLISAALGCAKGVLVKSVPWASIIENRDEYFEEGMFPPGFELKEPSRAHEGELAAFIRHVMDMENPSDGSPPRYFRFKAYRDQKGNWVRAQSTSEDGTPPVDPDEEKAKRTTIYPPHFDLDAPLKPSTRHSVPTKEERRQALTAVHDDTVESMRRSKQDEQHGSEVGTAKKAKKARKKKSDGKAKPSAPPPSPPPLPHRTGSPSGFAVAGIPPPVAALTANVTYASDESDAGELETIPHSGQKDGEPLSSDFGEDITFQDFDWDDDTDSDDSAAAILPLFLPNNYSGDSDSDSSSDSDGFAQRPLATASSSSRRPFADAGRRTPQRAAEAGPSSRPAADAGQGTRRHAKAGQSRRDIVGKGKAIAVDAPQSEDEREPPIATRRVALAPYTAGPAAEERRRYLLRLDEHAEYLSMLHRASYKVSFESLLMHTILMIVFAMCTSWRNSQRSNLTPLHPG